MSVRRGLAIVAISAVGFGVAGGLLGLALGVGMPGYYRGVFRAAADPGFRPAEVGFGLGCTQGAAAGVIVGLVLVIATAMRGRRADETGPVSSRAGWSRRLVVLLLLLGGMAGSGVVGFVAGALVGQTLLYRLQGEDRISRVQPVLRDPAFRAVQAEATSDGQLVLLGTVASDEDRPRLLERLRFLFGDQEARHLAADVNVAVR